MSASQRLLTSFVLLALIVGCGKDKAEGDKSEPADTTQPEAKSAKEPDYKLTVAELEEETKKDQPGTQKKYAGKVLELSGIVETPIIDGGQPQVGFSLKSAKPRTEYSFFKVLCNCDDRSVFGTLGSGQTLRVRGVYNGAVLMPTISHCEILERGPEAQVRISAEQLAAEFTANGQDADKKYGGKTLVLTGTVSKINSTARVSVFP